MRIDLEAYERLLIEDESYFPPTSLVIEELKVARRVIKRAQDFMENYCELFVQEKGTLAEKLLQSLIFYEEHF